MRRTSANIKSPHRTGAAAMLGALAVALSIACAAAQSAPQPEVKPQDAPNTNPQSLAPPPAENPGLLQEIGRLFERGLGDPFGSAKRQMDDAAKTTKNIGDKAVEIGKTATDAVVKPLTTRVVSGHERCAIAPNGAPDCITAAEALCRKHGYTTGKSVDFTSAEQCSPTVYLAGRQNAPVCATVTFISRAMCQ